MIFPCSTLPTRYVLSLLRRKTVTMPIHGRKASISCTGASTCVRDTNQWLMIPAGSWLTLTQYKQRWITGMSWGKAHHLCLFIVESTGKLTCLLWSSKSFYKSKSELISSRVEYLIYLLRFFFYLFDFRGEFLVLDSDVIIIGAASGNVAESVILERDTESTVMFVEGKNKVKVC